MGFSKLIAFLGDNSAQTDASTYENKIRSDEPELLQDDERIVFAFKGRGGKGRDSFMLTSKRVLVKDKKGVTGKRIEYLSVPYDSIRAFSVETAGSVDTDQELKIYARSVGKIALDFVNEVNVWEIKRFLSSKVLQGKGAGAEAGGAMAHDAGVNMSGGTGIFDLIGSNFSQIDPKTVESRLKSEPNILLSGETVELAFQCGRDSFILTSKRIIKIDVQGVTGKKVEILTILWATVKGFSVETAGNIFDRDSELTVYLNIPTEHSRAEGFPRNHHTRMKIDFRDGKADIFAVQRYFADKVLGMDTMSSSKYGTTMAGYHDSGSNSALAWLGDDNRMIDATVADRQFHLNPSILQNCETVEMAFKGRRDMMLFTGKRIIFVDVQGFFGLGKKVEYISLPWTTVTAFSVRTAGSWVDKDSEMTLWLDFDDVFNPMRDNEDDPPPPPIPRRSHLEIDFQKDKVDVLVVHRYLSERCMRVNGHDLRPFDSPVSEELLHPSPPATLEGLMNWIGNDAAAIDSDAVDNQFHDAGILQVDEHVAFAFKTGRDSLYFTNKRVFIIDVQGFTGKRKEYISIPFDSIRAWCVYYCHCF